MVIAYYVAQSSETLEAVCESLRTHYCLPDFDFDSHDSWRHGWSRTAAIGFNDSM